MILLQLLLVLTVLQRIVASHVTPGHPAQRPPRATGRTRSDKRIVASHFLFR